MHMNGPNPTAGKVFGLLHFFFLQTMCVHEKLKELVRMNMFYLAPFGSPVLKPDLKHTEIITVSLLYQEANSRDFRIICNFRGAQWRTDQWTIGS